MKLQESIRRILREETQKLPGHVLRRVTPQNFLNGLKMSVIYYNKYGEDMDDTIWRASVDVAYNSLPEDDEIDIDSIASDFADFLFQKYSNEIKEYINKVYSAGVFDDDGYIYKFVRHFNMELPDYAKNYDTWGDLLNNNGYMFPIDWWKLKDELDKIDNGEIFFMRPNDVGNDTKYYYSIVKVPKVTNSLYQNKDYKRGEIKL